VEPKPPSETPAIRVVLMPRDANPQGSIFGGVILSLIDQAAFVEAVRQASHHRFVTVAFETIEFHEPVMVGDVVSLWATTERIGTTSIRVRVDVCAQRAGESHEEKVTSGHVVLVAVNDRRRPVEIATGRPRSPGADA
jgi:acyl-CoA thioesterase YciA